MEIFLIIILVVIFLQTSYLVGRNSGGRPGGSTRRGFGMMFVDTSVLIDGRIISLLRSGFVGRKLAIPRSVVGELQLLADQSDSQKRARARRGLDVIAEIQAIPNVDVVIFPDKRKASEGVDNRLLKLAKRHHGALCTLDFNLNKVAKTEDIEVLNINDLAMNLRAAYLPGETLDIYLLQKGQDAQQAVGFLQDGTMVVVENAKSKLGQKVKVRFTRSLQTEAGKMMFAELADSEPGSSKKTVTTHKKQKPVKDTTSKNKKNSSHNKPKSRKGNQQEDKIVDLMNN